MVMTLYLLSALVTLAVAAPFFAVATKIGNLYPMNRNASLLSLMLFGIGATLAAAGLLGVAAWFVVVAALLV
jgi:hypothetical protein